MRAARALALISLLGCATTRAQREQAQALSLQKQLARAMLAQHQWAQASKPLLELKQVSPEDPEVHAMLGTVYREQALYDDSMSEYGVAMKLAPKSAEAWDGRGILREVRGDAGDDALADFQRAIELEPHNPAHYNNLGFALYLRGKWLEAVKAFRAALREDPSGRRAHNNLGFAYGQLGHLARAKSEFGRGGGQAVAENNLGAVLEKDDPKAACERYEAASLLDDKLDAARENAARVCAKSAAQGGSAP